MGSRFFWYLIFFLLSAYVLAEQLLDPYRAGFELVVSRHQDMLKQEAYYYNPWQYRILSTYLLEGFIQLFRIISLPQYIAEIDIPQLDVNLSQHLPYIVLKWIVLYTVFWAADRYYQAIGLEHPFLRLAGIWLLAFVMYPAQFSAGLSLDIYIEVIFYLWAGWLIMHDRYVYIIPLTILAAFNRESSGFIPLMLGLYIVMNTGSDINLFSIKRQHTVFYLSRLSPFLISVACYVAIFVGLRYYFGYPSPRSVYGNVHFSDYLLWNISQPTTYIQLLRSFTLLPVIAIFTFRKWPSTIKAWSWMLIPAWVILHLSFAVARETRLFLVPLSLLVIPGSSIALWRTHINLQPKKHQN